MSTYFVFHRYAIAELNRLRAAGVPDLRMRSATTIERKALGASWVVEQRSPLQDEVPGKRAEIRHEA